MLEFFSKMLGYVEMFFEYLINIVESLFTFVFMIPNAMSLPLSLIGYLPSIIGVAVTSVMAIGVIKILAGR